MRGSRAKKLHRIALEYVLTIMKKSAGEGYNEYNQAMNRIEWEHVMDDKGMPLMIDGDFMKKPGKAAGTITCAWHTRVMYKQLKKRWKHNGGA